MSFVLADCDPPPGFRWAALVPELIVSDLERSLRFWVDLIGFQVAYARPAERFAFLHHGSAQVMLEERGERQWVTGALEPPLGRGVNFQIETASCETVARRLAEAGWPVFEPVHSRWYRVGRREVGQEQFLVQDPDGYLLRLCRPTGERLARDRGVRQ